MPRRAQPFTLFKRRYIIQGKETFIWYYQVKDPESGKYMPYSTGETAKTKASALVQELFRTGKLIPEPVGPTMPTIQEYSQEFWKFDSDRVKSALKRKRLTPAYCESMHRTLELHWWPEVGDLPLDKLTLKAIDELAVRKLDGDKKKGQKPLSTKMVQQIVAAMKAVYDDALDHEVIAKNPFAKFKPIRIQKTARSVLTPDQARFLLSDPQHFETPGLWTLNLTACATGCRAGELLGLRVKSVHGTWFQVEAVKRSKVGVVEDTKTGEQGKRAVPVPPKVSQALADLCKGKKPDDLVFGDLPFYVTSQSLARALEKAGILGNKERIASHIDFHSWRHLYTTLFKGRVSDQDLKATTGHQTDSMLANYSDHVLPEHLETIAQVQKEVFRDFGAPSPP
jgi:integrase